MIIGCPGHIRVGQHAQRQLTATLLANVTLGTQRLLPWYSALLQQILQHVLGQYLLQQLRLPVPHLHFFRDINLSYREQQFARVVWVGLAGHHDVMVYVTVGVVRGLGDARGNSKAGLPRVTPTDGG